MSRRYNTNTIIDRFRVCGALRVGLVWALILSMFMPAIDTLAFNFNAPTYSSRSSSGGGEKDATIYYFNGKEWTTAPLAMEANDDKADSISNSPLFYHNGIMWVKTDMYEEDVKGSKVMKVDLPLEKLAGKPDVGVDGLVSALDEPIKAKPRETASGDVAPVLDQPKSKLEQNLTTPTNHKPNRTLPVLTDGDVLPDTKPIEQPIAAPVVTSAPAPTPSPKTVTEPVKAPAPKVADKPVVVPVVTSAPATTPAPKTVTEPVKAPAPKVADKPAVVPVVTSAPAPTPSPKTVTEPVKAPAPKVAENPVVNTSPKTKTTSVIEPVANVAPNSEPIPITAMSKPINWDEYEKVNNTAVRKDVVTPAPDAPKPTETPVTYTSSKPAPKLDVVPSKTGITNAKPLEVPSIVIGAINESPVPIVSTSSVPKLDVTAPKNIIADAKPLVVPVLTISEPVVANVPGLVIADKQTEVPKVAATVPPTKETSVIADAKPIVTPMVVEHVPTVVKPDFPPKVNPLVRTEGMPLVFKPEYLSANAKTGFTVSPIPLLNVDAQPLNLLNYNMAVPMAYYESPSIAYRPERGPAPMLPANFIMALSSKHANIQVTVDTPPATNPLTNFIKSGNDEIEKPGEETLNQEPKKEAEAPKEEEPKKNKKKDKDAEPVVVEQPVSIDSIRKLIQDELNNAIGGKLPVSANTPEQVDTATVELPPSVTINDSIEELRKLNQQLQAELDEKLQLRNKLEDQVDEQRQIKKEAKLGGELGKKDTVKLSDDSYVVREYKFALENEIFGWHPYWMEDSYRSYDYSLLTTLAYFSYELNPNTGGYKSIHDWKTTEVVDLAREKGCKVVLTASCLNKKDLSTFLANDKAQNNFVATIRDLVVERNANGVNINFEKLSADYKNEYVALIKKLRVAFNELNPGYQISITIPAIDYNDAYDVEALAEVVDLFIMMGYEYTGSYSIKAGPTAPLGGGASYAQYNLGSSIDAYLKNKVPSNKLVLAIPYYGVQWEVEGYEVPGRAIKFIKSMSYAQIKAQYGDKEPFIYEASLTPYYNNQITGRYNMFDQVWFDNARSLGMKFDMIMEKQLGGVGIWALGMDGGNKEFWNVLEDKFLKIVPVPMDTITIKKADTGGGIGSWISTKFRRLLSILRRPSMYNPANSNFDNWLRVLMMLGGLTFVIARIRFIIRRLQMGSKYKASKPYLYVMITSIAVLTISLMMWARITRFFERIYASSSFLFTIGLIIGVLLAVVFILWILPKWLKNKELP